MRCSPFGQPLADYLRFAPVLARNGFGRGIGAGRSARAPFFAPFRDGEFAEAFEIIADFEGGDTGDGSLGIEEGGDEMEKEVFGGASETGEVVAGEVGEVGLESFWLRKSKRSEDRRNKVKSTG